MIESRSSAESCGQPGSLIRFAGSRGSRLGPNDTAQGPGGSLATDQVAAGIADQGYIQSRIRPPVLRRVGWVRPPNHRRAKSRAFNFARRSNALWRSSCCKCDRCADIFSAILRVFVGPVALNLALLLWQGHAWPNINWGRTSTGLLWEQDFPLKGSVSLLLRGMDPSANCLLIKAHASYATDVI